MKKGTDLCWCVNNHLRESVNIIESLYAVGFETWHLGLIAGIVVLISSSRFLLLKSWPDFADSSEAANQQVKKHSIHSYIDTLL